MMHKWWARRLGVVFRMLLLSQAADEATPDGLWKRFYSSDVLPEDFTVLDPFLGGGTSLVEAAKLGAHCVGLDVDPVACFVTQMELTPPPADRIRERFQEIQTAVIQETKRLYESFVNRQRVDVIYNFWVDRITCPDCGRQCDGHPTYQLAYCQRENHQTVICPGCDEIAEIPLDRKCLYCSACGKRTDLGDPPVRLGRFRCPTCYCRTPIYLLYQQNLAKPRLFAKEYLAPDGGRGFASISARDLQLYAEAENLLKKHGSKLPLPGACTFRQSHSSRHQFQQAAP